jgi:addiction module HigA family antidote
MALMTGKPIPLDESKVPDLIIPPGETLREELHVRGISQIDFATKIGRPVRVINEIINGKKAITAETALQFEEALGIPAHFWLNLESQYRLDLARRAAPERKSARSRRTAPHGQESYERAEKSSRQTRSRRIAERRTTPRAE